ncbi:hypothetical protein [Microvirga subterranea]|uniref:Uncharacterized protein n=1 Tax=Microvirga subterranea TaxID=186651 RepID=A0A370H385_9HYPH|nr:hypothetical protein [Microvirga subterranea]RDI50487.1 hypothetical protein DES45_1206 [Microvirga subterranea]
MNLGRAYQNLLDKATTAIVRRSPNIAHEDLRIRNMTASVRGLGENPRTNVRKKAGLNRAILAPGVQRLRACQPRQPAEPGEVRVHDMRSF